MKKHENQRTEKSRFQNVYTSKLSQSQWRDSIRYLCLERFRKQWVIYYSERGKKYDIEYYDSEERACEVFYRILKNIENTVYVNEEQDPFHKPHKIPREWWINDILISSRSSADIYFGDKLVRIPGELMADYFLAEP